MMKKVKILLLLPLSILLTGLTYFINNKGQCCDLIFQAGWPLPFYGGSGGFMGYTSNHVIISGLGVDLLFWVFILGFVLFNPIFLKQRR